MQPDLQQLIVVTGTDPTDIAWEQAARSELSPSRVSWKSHTFQACPWRNSRLKSAGFRQIPPFCSVIGEDGAGRRLLRTQVLGQVAQAAAAPVYFVSALYLDTVSSGEDFSIRRRWQAKSLS
jgi:hypothetical protein